MLYLAHRAPEFARPKRSTYKYQDKKTKAGNKLYKELVASVDVSPQPFPSNLKGALSAGCLFRWQDRPWVANHSWQSWRNQYVTNAEAYDNAIAQYLSKHPGVRGDHDRIILDMRDEPGYNLTSLPQHHFIKYGPYEPGCSPPRLPRRRYSSSSEDSESFSRRFGLPSVMVYSSVADVQRSIHGNQSKASTHSTSFRHGEVSESITK